MKIFVQKTPIGLIPVSTSDFDNLQIAKLKEGEIYQVELKKPRNIGFHNKFFSLLNACYENQEVFDNPESLRRYLTIKSGYYTTTLTDKGVFYDAKSISFSSMDQIEFEKFYDAFIFQVIEFLGCDENNLIEELNKF